jgi:plasmid stabilization system protein ParE
MRSCCSSKRDEGKGIATMSEAYGIKLLGHRVSYRVRGETIEILRVFHTSRRLPARW